MTVAVRSSDDAGVALEAVGDFLPAKPVEHNLTRRAGAEASAK